MLSILDFCAKKPSKNGALPVARLKKLWTMQYENGRTDRAWNYHRVKAMRDTLSQLGWLIWEDNTYCCGEACKWSLDRSIFEEKPVEKVCKWPVDGSMVDDQEVRDGTTTISVDTCFPKGPGEYLKPEHRYPQIDHAWVLKRFQELKRVA